MGGAALSITELRGEHHVAVRARHLVRGPQLVGDVLQRLGADAVVLEPQLLERRPRARVRSARSHPCPVRAMNH